MLVISCHWSVKCCYLIIKRWHWTIVNEILVLVTIPGQLDPLLSAITSALTSRPEWPVTCRPPIFPSVNSFFQVFSPCFIISSNGFLWRWNNSWYVCGRGLLVACSHFESVACSSGVPQSIIQCEHKLSPQPHDFILPDNDKKITCCVYCINMSRRPTSWCKLWINAGTIFYLPLPDFVPCCSLPTWLY